MTWNQDPDVLSPVGRPMTEQLAEGPLRQPLQGFDPVYRDIVDYIADFFPNDVLTVPPDPARGELWRSRDGG